MIDQYYGSCVNPSSTYGSSYYYETDCGSSYSSFQALSCLVPTSLPTSAPSDPTLVPTTAPTDPTSIPTFAPTIGVQYFIINYSDPYVCDAAPYQFQVYVANKCFNQASYGTSYDYYLQIYSYYTYVYQRYYYSSDCQGSYYTYYQTYAYSSCSYGSGQVGYLASELSQIPSSQISV